MLPRHARCMLSHLRCNGHSHLLSSYLSRIGRFQNPSCSACGHSSQDTSHFISHCPVTDSLRRSLFGDSLRPLVQALRSFSAFGAPWCSAMPPSFKRGRVTTTSAQKTWKNLFPSAKGQLSMLLLSTKFPLQLNRSSVVKLKAQTISSQINSEALRPQM